MLLGFLTVILMLVVAYAFWRQGVLPAFVMAVNVLLAGLIAFNFFEPIAAELDPMLAGSFVHKYEDSLCLIFLFCLTLVFLRWATNGLMHSVLEYHPILQQGGAVLFGLLAGYLVAGFLLCVAQTLPMDANFLQFEAKIDTRSAGAKIRHVLPADRVWLALMHRASLQSLGWDDTLFDPDGSFELRYRHERRDSP
jgi:uncharacterized membrane protein required for colicin V production